MGKSKEFQQAQYHGGGPFQHNHGQLIIKLKAALVYQIETIIQSENLKQQLKHVEALNGGRLLMLVNAKEEICMCGGRNLDTKEEQNKNAQGTLRLDTHMCKVNIALSSRIAQLENFVTQIAEKVDESGD